MKNNKYYRVYAEINLDAIVKNVDNLMALTKENTGALAVVKADGYGHGDVAVAKAVAQKVTGYAVATPVSYTHLVFEDVDISVVKNANILSAPGIGDDTCNAAFLMAVMKTLIGQKCRTLKNLLFVFDTGEEGLGNCRGTRQLMQDYKDKVDEVISFDLGSDAVCVKAVGSKRYRVTVTAPGGHSFHAFGQKGAIETAAEIIHEIYRIKPCEGTQTTYNVGMIDVYKRQA